MFEGVRNESKHLQSLLWLDVEPAIIGNVSYESRQSSGTTAKPKKNVFHFSVFKIVSNAWHTSATPPKNINFTSISRTIKNSINKIGAIFLRLY